MNVITLDFETYFADDYTLSKMTTEAYIRDPRFEVHGVGIRWTDADKGSVEWIPGKDLHNFFMFLSQPANATAVLCHHAAFDGLILNHHYGFKPARWLDTYSMAAYLFPNAPKGLDALATRFGLSAKTVPYDRIKGKHWREMDRGAQEELEWGCLHDCELTYTIFQKMMTGDY